MIQIGDINNKIDGINIKIGDIEKILEGFKDGVDGEDGAPGLPGEDGVDGKDAIVNGITNRILKKLKEDKDYETPLNNISEFLQLLVITKQLIVDTLFMMRNNGGVGGDRGGMRKAAIDDNTGKISRNIKRLNEIEVMSVINPLVDDVNKLLANFTAIPGDISSRLIPMDITPLYAKEEKLNTTRANRESNITKQQAFDDTALGEALSRREQEDVVAQEAKRVAEEEKQRQQEAAQRAAAESARVAAEAEAKRLEEERKRLEAVAAANAAKQAELKSKLTAIESRLTTKLESLNALLGKKKTYKEYLDDEENKALRQLLELYSKVKSHAASSKKFPVDNPAAFPAESQPNSNSKINSNQTGGYGFYQIGGSFDGAAKDIRDMITKLSPQIETVYGHWKDNTKIEGGDYTDVEYRVILSNLKTQILDGKSEQELETQIMGWREEILKIPGIIVKVTDWFRDIRESDYNSSNNTGYVDVIGDTCLSVGSDDASKPNCGNFQKYGPFRYAVGPSNNENPTNSDVFNYLTGEDKYNLGNVLATPNQDVKLFGYGFSGSGKTYTLLQGSPTDKSLFVQTLELVKSTPGLNFADSNAIGVDIFYPMRDKKKSKDSVFAISSPIGKQMSEKLEVFRTSLESNKGSGNTQDIITGLKGIENTLLDYLLVLPTSNNPRSSRAFTIVSINLRNGSSIKFIDLPGLEKKVDMIRDHYYPTKSSEDIKAAIGNKGVDKVSSEVTITGFGGFYEITGSVTVQKASGGTGGNKIDKFTYDSKINTKNYTESLIIGLKNRYLKKIAFNNFNLELIKGYNYTDLLKNYLIKLICFTNYQYELVEGYTYTLPTDSEIKDFIKNFEDAFLGDGNKKTSKSRTASEKVYEDIMENVFNLKYEDTNSKIDLDSIKGTFVSPILDILYALIKYLSEDRNVKAGISLIPEDDKQKAILLFMIMFTQFTLEQGDAIVTSLEHLLFEFLNQIPDGINKFNATDGVTPFELNGGKYKDRKFTISSSSGMTETVESTYLQGMHDVLNIGENSRFINLLTILRRKKSEVDTNKRCQGARDTLEFGETLVQSNAALCGEKGELKGKDSAIIAQIEKLQKVIDLRPKGILTQETVKEFESEANTVLQASRKYRRNVRNNNDACSIM